MCFGKGMGNGLPISAITGKAEFMKVFDKLWVSSTNNRETLSMAGCFATIQEMKKKNSIKHCWNIGKKLFSEWNKISERYGIMAKMYGYPIRMTLNCFNSNQKPSKSLKALILQEMVKKGIFLSPGPTFISYSHTEKDIDFTLSAWEKVCKYISIKTKNKNYDSFLEGNLPETIWTLKIKPTKK